MLVIFEFTRCMGLEIRAQQALHQRGAAVNTDVLSGLALQARERTSEITERRILPEVPGYSIGRRQMPDCEFVKATSALRHSAISALRSTSTGSIDCATALSSLASMALQ